MFVDDYKPTKRVGMEELHGCIVMLADKLDDMDANGEAHEEFYKGALITMELFESSRFKYPNEFMAVFENKVNELTE